MAVCNLNSVVYSHIPQNLNPIINCTSVAVDIIDIEKNKQHIGDNSWDNTIYRDINRLKANNVGNVGEKIVQTLFSKCGIDCNVDGSMTKQSGGGTGDGYILGNTVEIKTARQGKTRTFQHELGEHPWKSSFMILVDFTPSCYYLTIIKNFSKKHYITNNRNALPYFDKTITRRKQNTNTPGAFKLTLNLKDLEKDGDHIIKICDKTTIKHVTEFVNKQINKHS